MFTSLTIRSKLLLLVAICIFPIYGILFYNAWASTQHATEKNRIQLQIDAQATASDIDEVIRGAAGLLYSFKNIPQLRVHNRIAPCDLMATLISVDSRYKNGYIIQPDGLIQCYTQSTAARGNVSGQGYFRRAMSSGRVEVGLPGLCHGTEGFCFPMALALHNASGQVTSVLALDIDPVWLAKRAALTWSEQNTLMVWWDGEARVAFAWPQTENWSGKLFIDNKVGINMLGKSAGHFIEEGIDGKTKLFGYSTIRGIGSPDMKLSLGVPQDALNGPIQMMFVRNLTLLTLIAVIAFTLAWLFGIYFVERFEELSQMVKRIGTGNRRNSRESTDETENRRRHSETDYSKDEFGRLAYTINEMTEKSITGMRNSNSQLRTIIKKLSEGATLYRLDENLLFHNNTKGKNDHWLQTSLDQLPEGVMLFDMEGQLLYCNQATLDLYGFTNVDQFLRYHQSGLNEIFDLASPEGILWAAEQWPFPRLLHGESLYDMNTNLLNKKERWQKNINYSGKVINDKNDKPFMAVLIMREITEHNHPTEPHRFFSEFVS